MLLLPFQTNIRPKRTPYTNYALIFINIIIFFLTYHRHINPLTGEIEILRHWAEKSMLDPRPGHLHIWQFISYAFLHGSYLHIVGNIFFLYLFGNNVNDKLGNFKYLCLYLAGAIFSGIGHTILHYNPVLGASAAVTGAYLVLFPQSLITVLYIFFFIGTIEVPALYFIAFKMILIDTVIIRFTPDIAYDAHLAGYAFGIAASLLLLATGLISSSNFDLWAMIKRWNRRRQYKDAISRGYDPFAGQVQRKRINVTQINNTTSQQTEQMNKLREEISKRIGQRNLPAAAELYLELLKLDDKQILPRQHLLDIANQLASESKHKESAQAYEQFLAHYSNYEYAEQVQLMLGLIYSRYLNMPEQAIKHLQTAAEKLSDPGQLKMCRDDLARLQK
jgi:membrane associated rhomboid family serine protease